MGILAVLAVLIAGAVPAQASARAYRGVMTNGGSRAVHSGEQGAIWRSRFVEHKRGRVSYSACVIFLDGHNVVRCKVGRTNGRGVSRLGFRQFVNLRPGHWAVRFFGLGHRLAAWNFTVRPEEA
jgi:hypothetical protein